MKKTNKKKASVPAPPAVQPLVYDIPAAAEALRLSVSTVRKLIRRDLLKVSRIGDRVLIQEKALLAVLDQAEGGKGINTRYLDTGLLDEDSFDTVQG